MRWGPFAVVWDSQMRALYKYKDGAEILHQIRTERRLCLDYIQPTGKIERPWSCPAVGSVDCGG